MSEPLFPQGTKVTWAAWSGAAWETGVELKDLRGINGNTRTMSFSDVTSILDIAMRRRPARLDYGTLTLTFTMTNEEVSKNQLPMFFEALADKKRHKLTVNFADAFDDTTPVVVFEGYISSVSNPDIEIGDNVLTFNVGLQVDPPLPTT